MSYTALYRKFRPQDFDNVKGQEHIVKSLQNQIKNNRIGHAYLFTGTRGTGKTTVAKIFAKAVNCQDPKDGSPCGQCSVCKGIQEGSILNVIEIDAASNNSVNNIREIIDEVEYAPTEGKYKVYIIDEVHMLTLGAFNALLKTLEEPPSYVMFILATTEVHKIPITILSRCQRYDFRRITTDTISARLKELIDVEGVDVEDKAISYIARVADGSMRDALSLLDQCIAFYLNEKLTYDGVLSVLGAVDTMSFANLLDAVYEQDVTKAVDLISEAVSIGRDLNQYVVDFIWYLRNLLLVKSSPALEDVVEMSAENLEVLKKQASVISEEVLMRYILVLSALANDIKYSSQKRVLLEMAIIKLCKPQMESDFSSLEDRIRSLEKQVEEGIKVNPASIAPAMTATRQEAIVEVTEKKMMPKALEEDIRYLIENVPTEELLKCVPKSLGIIGRESKCGFTVTPNMELQLILACDNRSDKDNYDKRFASEDIMKDFADNLSVEYKKQFKVSAITHLTSKDLGESYQLIDEIRAAAMASGKTEVEENKKFEV